METTSKGLIISGAVLIAILLISGGVYIIDAQLPEIHAQKATETMWQGVDINVGLGGNVNAPTEDVLRVEQLFLEAVEGQKGGTEEGEVNIPVDSIENIKFINNMSFPSGELATEDVSAKKDKKIMAYAYDANNNGYYEVIVGQEGGVKANTNSYKFLNGAENLKTIDLENLDTSKTINIGAMFNKCKSLITIKNLDKLDTSNVEVMNHVFSECYAITSLDLSNFKTSKVTTMRSMFQYCESLTTIDLTTFDTSKVEDIANMFAFCKNVTSIDVSSFNTEEVKDMQGMFGECASLISLDVTNFRTQNVENMFMMFSNINKVEELDLSSFDTAKVKNMAGMFDDCSSLTKLKIQSFNTSNVEDMQRMFYNCASLTSLNLNNFNTTKVKNMYGMFDSCTNLETLDITTFDTNQVVDASYMFALTYNLKTLILGENFKIKSGAAVEGITNGTTSTVSQQVQTRLNK